MGPLSRSLWPVALVLCQRYPPWVRAFPFKSPLPGRGKHQPVKAVYFGKPMLRNKSWCSLGTVFIKPFATRRSEANSVGLKAA